MIKLWFANGVVKSFSFRYEWTEILNKRGSEVECINMIMVWKTLGFATYAFLAGGCKWCQFFVIDFSSVPRSLQWNQEIVS